jgi:hypothetical protein
LRIGPPRSRCLRWSILTPETIPPSTGPSGPALAVHFGPVTHGQRIRYADSGSDAGIIGEIRPRVLARGHLTRPEFLKICAWKTVRTKSRARQNSSREIETLTRAAFATSDDALKMELLRLLHAVDWPTASTILHHCDALPYPILDYRALWSLGYAKPPNYSMAFWLDYVACTRDLAARLSLPMRTVDRALWQYSKERQGR